MKKLSFLLLVFFSVGVRAQWVSIPDTNFGTWLNTNGYAACLQGNNGVGWQMDTSCPAVVNDTLVDCNSSNLRDLTGIQYFDNLQQLNCILNQLSNLPALPDSLWRLSCTTNQLTSLPPLPSGLIILSCGNNQLSSLPSLPSGLIDLSCMKNQLVSIPNLPNSLVWLRCWDNHISSLPAFPDSLGYCQIGNNPINCLPQLKRIDYLEFSNTNITCLPNYGNVTNSIPPLVSIPLCDVFNNNGCEVLWNISGKTYYDGNSNCQNDGNDTAQRNMKVQLWSNGNLMQQAFSGGEGFYSLDTDSLDAYELSIDTTNIPFYVSCPANNLLHDTITLVDSFHYSRDFALQCKTGFDLAALSVEGRFVPSRIRQVNIHVGDIANLYGVRCAIGVSGSVTITMSGAVIFISPANGALTPIVSGNVLTYNIADFGAVNFNSDFNIIVQTDTNAVIGSQVCFIVSVTPTIGDNNPANNTLTHCFTVVGSFDPNDKQVYPFADIDTAQEWLTYTINFQNTGTAEAQHIYVTDTLDSDLDAASFQLLAYSHQPLVQIKEKAVRFNFPNINLPDSNANEPLSHGYVQYKIKLKDNLPIGTQINNTAFIYFDFNAPVVTNTVTNTLCLSDQTNLFASICNDEFYDFNGSALNLPGVYSNTLTNGTGCDSIVTLMLSVEDQTTSNIQATISTGSSYNFNGTLLTTAGTYTDTLVNESGCDSIVTLDLSVVSSISNADEASDMKLLPNPASDFVTVTLDQTILSSVAIVTDITGRKMVAVQLQTPNTKLETQHFANGVYFITVISDNHRITRKLVVSK